MKIGIIGTGAIGSTIAEKLSKAGHEVKVNNTDDPQKLAVTAQKLGAEPTSIDNLIKTVDVIIISIPTAAIPTLSKNFLNDASKDVIIVDTSNYYPFRDGEIEDLKNGKVESVWVSEQLGRPVIKAFNNLLAHTLTYAGKTEKEKDRIAMAVSGDDEKSKKVIFTLINEVGFDYVDAGTLSESWKHQPGTPAYCTELNTTELKQALLAGVKEDAAYLRDLAITKLMEFTTQPTHEEVVTFNRSLFHKKPNAI